MYNLCNFVYILVKKPERIGVCKHKPGYFIAHQFFQCINVYTAPVVGFHLNYVKAYCCSRGGIRAVG